MTDVGDAFVRVRPDTRGFKAEAEGTVSKAGKDLGKIFAAAFAIGGVAETVKSVVEAASEHQAAFAVLEQNVKNAGAANVVYGKTLEALLEQEARLKGFSDEQLASAFQRLVSVTHDSGKAFKDLTEAEDLARFRHIDVAQAALALAKAEQGNANSLQRYGIQAVHVTTQADALRARYTQLVESGVKLDASQKAQYDSSLKAAEAHDKQASAAATLALVEQRAGGSASKFADTASGQWQRLGQDFHQFEVTLGEDVLPALTSAAEVAGKWFTELAKNEDVQKQFKQALDDIGAGFHGVEAVAKTVGPPLAAVTGDIGGLTKAVEALALAFVAGKIITSLGAVGGGETVAATAAAGYTESLAANTLALQANTIALGGEAAALDAVGASSAATGAKVSGLRSSLSRLALIGAIAIPIEILLNKKAIDQGVSSFLDQHGLGFLGSGTETPQAVLSQYGKIAHTFGDQVADKFHTEAQKEIAAQNPFTGLFALAAKAGQGVSGVASSEAITGAAKGAVDQIQSIFKQVEQDAKAGKTHDAAAKAGAAAIKSLRQGIAADQTDLAGLKTDMTDAIQQGIQAVNDAVQSAKQNFNQIGQDIASSIAAIIDKPLTDAQTRLSNAQDRIAAVFDRKTADLQTKSRALQRESDKLSLAGAQKSLKDLRQEVLLPGGHSLNADPDKAIAQLEKLAKKDDSPALQAFILQFRQASLAVEQGKLGLKTSGLDARRQSQETALQLKGDALKLTQDIAATQKTAAQRRIADLTDEFNKGALSYASFHKRLTNVLVAAGVNRKTALKELGVAGADQLGADLQGLGAQAGASAAGPQRAGTGLLPSIVRPLQTLHESEKQIAGIAKQQREKQLDETKKQTALLTKIHNAQKASKFTSSLAHNPGGASKTQKDLTGVSS